MTTDFDSKLIADAKERRNTMLEAKAKCCGTCMFRSVPANPELAAYYVVCMWSRHNDLPCHESPARLERIMSQMSGTNCATYKPEPTP